MKIETIAVVGAGFMGAGIAQLAAQKGYRVLLLDTDAGRLDSALQGIVRFLEKLHAKRALDAPPQTIFQRIAPTMVLSDLADVDVVLEAITEKPEAKQELFRALDELCHSRTLFGSNTSTIPIAMLAEATQRPEKVAGTHFFFPVPLNPLLEIIPAAQTAAATTECFLELGRSLGKYNVLVKQDVPGFIMNRVFGALTCEAIRLVERGVASVEDIDTGLTTGYGMLQGPLAKADAAGLDVCLLAFQNIFDLDGSIEPPALLRRLVSEGKLGRKSGEGFYHYDPQGRITGPAL